MTTQSNVSSPIEVAPERQFSWLLALVILALGILLGILGSNMTAIVGKADVSNVAEQTSRDFPPRPNMLELEKRTIVADAARAQAAETARYNSLGLFYAAGKPALAAETARYEGLTEYYGAVAEPRSLAWPPRPNQFFLEKNGIESDPNADIGLME